MAERMKFSWWQRLWPFHPWRLVEVVDDADEIAAQLPRNGVSFVGTVTNPKWIAFDCPCRTGHRVMINGDPVRKPCWKAVVGTDQRVTISPSVDYADRNKRCHYFVRHGKVEWARDSWR